MKVLWATEFIREIVAAIDTGEHSDISVAEVEEHIEDGDLFPWLKDRLRGTVDLSLFRSDEVYPLLRWFQGQFAAHAGNESRNWGVTNSGLCLLVAWANEMVKQAAGLPLALAYPEAAKAAAPSCLMPMKDSFPCSSCFLSASAKPRFECPTMPKT